MYNGGRRWPSRPHLVTIFPIVASTSLYHNWVTLNGAWRLSFNFGWGADRQESRIMQNTGIHTMKGGPESQRYDKVLSPSAADRHAGAAGPPRAVLYRLDPASRLRRLLEKAERRRGL